MTIHVAHIHTDGETDAFLAAHDAVALDRQVFAFIAERFGIFSPHPGDFDDIRDLLVERGTDINLGEVEVEGGAL